MQLADVRLDEASRQVLSGRLLSLSGDAMTPAHTISAETALQLGWLGLADILVFFCVLLVGFAYVWKRGDLDWIRALAKKSAQAADQSAARI
ncbi:MAG: NADH-quinone oxidoreductase subunit A [Planctomycetaceae bacterium]|jgi:NADH-quinone oxidoreductase subunit A